MKDVSVIIPSYKPGDYVWQCLDSLYGQTLDRSRFEVIVVLNGCNEPWASRIDGWIAKHPGFEIRLIQTDTPGVSNARNVGLDNAAGEYVAFVDDDDYVSPRYLEALLERSSRDTVALTDSVYFDDDTDKVIVDNPHHRVFSDRADRGDNTLLKTRVFFNGPVMKLLHRGVIGDRRFDVRFRNGEDSLMMLCVSDRIRHVCFTSPDAVYYRRIRINSATTGRRSLMSRLKNNLSLMVEYGRCVVSNPSGYDAAFVASRFLATIKSIIIK